MCKEQQENAKKINNNDKRIKNDIIDNVSIINDDIINNNNNNDNDGNNDNNNMNENIVQNETLKNSKECVTKAGSMNNDVNFKKSSNYLFYFTLFLFTYLYSNLKTFK